jgi:hypothetical protein
MNNWKEKKEKKKSIPVIGPEQNDPLQKHSQTGAIRSR